MNSLKLTKTELLVAELVKDGYNNQEIANKLFISLSTVKSHLENIFKKLEIKNRVQLAVWVVKNNI